jgi:hypothetical protein
MSTDQVQQDQQQQQPQGDHYCAGMAAHMGIEINLEVHCADGTTKPLKLFGRVTNIQKEQDHDDLRS